MKTLIECLCTINRVAQIDPMGPIKTFYYTGPVWISFYATPGPKRYFYYVSKYSCYLMENPKVSRQFNSVQFGQMGSLQQSTGLIHSLEKPIHCDKGYYFFLHGHRILTIEDFKEYVSIETRLLYMDLVSNPDTLRGSLL